MKKLLLLLTLISTISLCITSCSDDDDEETTTMVGDVACNTVTYDATVKAIVSTNCTLSGCHADGTANASYTTYEGLKTVVDNGKFKTRVIDLKTMPPAGALTTTQLNQLQCWLNDGAPNN